MKTWSSPTIQKSLLAALILLSGLVIVSSVIAWFVFEKINHRQQGLLNHSLPLMRFADSAADSGGDLLALSVALSKEVSSGEFSLLERQADFLLAQVQKDTASFEDNSANFSNTQQLKIHIQQLIEKIRQQLVLQGHLLENRSVIVDKIAYLQEKIGALFANMMLIDEELLSQPLGNKANNSAVRDPRYILTEMRFELLRLESIVERLLLISQKEQVNEKENVSKLSIKKINAYSLNLNGDKAKKMQESIAMINDAMLQKNSLFELVSERIDNFNKLAAIQEENVALGRSLNSLYSAISLKANYDVDLGAQSLIGIIKTSQLTLLVSSIVFLLMVLFLYFFFIQPRIIKRLVGLERDTRAIADNNYDVDINIDGNDEITAMAKSLAYFRNQLIEKHEVQKVLADREETLSTIVNNAAEGLFTVDVDGIIQTFNPACESIFELNFDNAIGENISRFFPAAGNIFVAHEEGPTNESYIVCKNQQVPAFRSGEDEFISSLSVSLINSSGRYLYSCFVRDITSEEMAKEQIEMLVNELTASNTDLESFAYSCSHDLQEPVRMVLSFSELLKEHLGHDIDETTAKYLDFITDGAKNAKKMIKDILAYSRLDQKSVKKEWIIADDLFEQVKNSIVVLQEELQGTVRWHGGNIKLYAVKSQLVQLLMNLVMNGLKYNDSSEPIVTVIVSECNDNWLLSVEDNGIGIDRRYHKKIFEVFQRLVTKREYVGSGIGLSICKKIVEKHHGEISLESEPNRGSRFFVRLPKNL